MAKSWEQLMRSASTPKPAPVAPAQQPTPSDLLTVTDVARRLRVGTRTVWRWVAEKRLPQPLRFTAVCVRWLVVDVDRFIAERAENRNGNGPTTAA